MAKEGLATLYRPKVWSDVVEQDTIKQILNHQIQKDDVKRVLLFTGPAGCGKTTNARIFAKELETCNTNIYELNCADKNGVDDVRKLVIEVAKSKPLQGKYKIFILDEVHMLTVQSQNALLKLLEEPPVYCIFILCTTDPQKILGTILSRSYRYDFQKISTQGIINRLNYILTTEKQKGTDIQSWEPEAISYIARQSSGHMRNGITTLDKILSYTNNITVESVVNVLGITDYEVQFQILEALLSKNEQMILRNLDELYNSGKDLKLFCKNFLTFCLDVNKYSVLRDINLTSIPNTYTSRLNILCNNKQCLKDIIRMLVNLNADMKWETNPKVLLEGTFLLSL